MVFKRRNKRPFLQALREAVWPRGGWTRAFHYIKHRLNRLPDRPERIARGIFAGVLISFTPLFGFHLGGAVVLAWLVRGNVIAALFGTLIGNPLTFPLIALVSIKLGHWMLGRHLAPVQTEGLFETFGHAFQNLHHNLVAFFTHEPTQWQGLANFFDGIFLPYLVGGLLPGIAAGLVCYFIALPIVTAYQNRRRTRLKERLTKIRAKISPRRKDGNAPPPGEG